MIGHAFFRDNQPEPNICPPGMKRVAFAGVALVPESFESTEAMYTFSPNKQMLMQSLIHGDDLSTSTVDFKFVRSTGDKFRGCSIGSVLCESDWTKDLKYAEE